MLLTDAFGGFGGISKFNRDFLTALDASPKVERVYVWPRLITEPIEEPLPQSVVYERKFARGKFAYVWQVARSLLGHLAIDLVICGHINLLPLAWLVAKMRRARLALIIHGIEAWQPTASLFSNALVRRVDALISVSHLSAERLRKWSKLPEGRTYVLPNSVDLARFTPGPRSPELVARYNLGGARVLMTLGRLASEERCKGFDEVLEILPELTARHYNLKYMIVGDGLDAARLKSKTVSLGVADKVVFAGRIPENQKVDHYRLADVYVMPSTGEGFGIVLIEAAACGISVIGSEVDGSREALLLGELGQLVDPARASELIAAVDNTLQTVGSPRRNSRIEFFDVRHFRSRVNEWLFTLDRD